MAEIIYKQLDETGIPGDLLADFHRRQEITKCWRFENGAWMLKNIAFVDDWDMVERMEKAEYLKNTAKNGGAVFAAFYDDVLVGFAAVVNEPFGSGNRYLQLSKIHVDACRRRHGIGKRLFALTAAAAGQMGAKKLYISANSSQETVAFYHALGCIDAQEINKALAEKEPCDRQMEYII